MIIKIFHPDYVFMRENDKSRHRFLSTIEVREFYPSVVPVFCCFHVILWFSHATGFICISLWFAFQFWDRIFLFDDQKDLVISVFSQLLLTLKITEHQNIKVKPPCFVQEWVSFALILALNLEKPTIHRMPMKPFWA